MLCSVVEPDSKDLGINSVKKSLTISSSLVQYNTGPVEAVDCEVTTPIDQSDYDTNRFDVKPLGKIEKAQLEGEGLINENGGSICELLLVNVKQEITCLGTDGENFNGHNPMSSIKVEDVRSLYEYIRDNKVWYLVS